MTDISIIGDEYNKRLRVYDEEWGTYITKNIPYVTVRYTVNTVVKFKSIPKSEYSDFKKKLKESTREKKVQLELKIKFNVVQYGEALGKGKGRGRKTISHVETKRRIVDITFSSQEEFETKLEDAFYDFEAEIAELYESDFYVDDVTEKSYSQVNGPTVQSGSGNISQTKMRSVVPITYKFLPELDLNIPSQDGMCVDEALIRIYKPYIPTLSSEKIDSIIEEYNNSEEDKININKEAGRSSTEVAAFCNHYKIAQYGIDVDNKVFHKMTYNSSNYPALMWYCIDSHMYIVDDEKTRKHIVRSSTLTTKTQTDLLQNIADKETEKATRFALESKEDIDISELENLKNCNVFYHESDLYNILIKLFVEKNIQYKSTFNGSQCVSIELDNGVVLFNNVNHRAAIKVGTEVMKCDWKDSMEICKKLNIPFTNQSIQSIAKTVYNDMHQGSRQFIRKMLSEQKKEELLLKQENQCNICEQNLPTKDDKCIYEVDHILPLSCGGNNEMENLQALCKKCHAEKTARETAEKTFNIDNTVSSFNIETSKIFKARKNGFIHVYKEKCGKKDKWTKLGLDINKCRANIIRYSMNKFCVFSVLDNIEIFDHKKYDMNKIPYGYYYVTTHNLLPLKGNGWYSYPIVQFCLNEKIIFPHNIQNIIKPSIMLPADYYANFVDKIRTTCGDYSKLMINGFIGLLGRKSSTERKVLFSNTPNEASYHYFKQNPNNRVYARFRSYNEEEVVADEEVVDFKNQKGFYEIIFEKSRQCEDSTVPIFNQILDLEAIELYKITSLLQKYNGRMLKINTDHSLAEFQRERDIEECKREAMTFFWDENKKVPKYKIDNKVSPKNSRTNVNTNLENYKCHVYNTITDPQSNDFSGLVKQVISLNQSFQIDGKAGTGKTHFLKMIQKHLDDNGIKYLALAPTNKACRVLGNAKTVHSFFGVYGKKGFSKISNYEYIIIDEKSMIKEIFFRGFFHIKLNTNCKFILAGDWNQLEPVLDRATFDYENSKAIHQLCDGNMVQLTHCRRADQDFFNEYTNVNTVDITKYGNVKCLRSICYRNALRKKINEEIMIQGKKKNSKKYFKVEKNTPDKNSQDIYVYKSLPLMCVKTNKKYNICNGDEFIVKSWTKDILTLHRAEDNNTMVEVLRKDIGQLFYPGYSITAHRSQGMSYAFDYTIYEWNIMDERMKYVALSRAKDRKYVNFVN